MRVSMQKIILFKSYNAKFRFPGIIDLWNDKCVLETEGDRYRGAPLSKSKKALTHPVLDAVGNDMFQSSMHQI